MFQHVMRGAAALSLAALLASCNTSGSGGGSGLFGSGSAQPAASQTAAAAAPAGAVVQSVCPQVSLRDGTAYYRTYAKSGSKDPQDVVYQASLAETTRACTRSDTALNIKVQVQGRLVAGPQGHAGTISAPIRVAVVEGEKVLYSELTPFSMTLASVDQPAQFLFSKDISVPGDVSPNAMVYVGFDEGPAKAPAKKARKK
ncbi:hypothetical protein [Rhizobium paknamense]|uniref:Lipoprotein n=1 Tax=Rhizobium paknamense TaxID=1206817 RepID=A0ABU0IA56_9HYPH|nr:hypothetical protein [Rhizobium paknamense]MDQ0455110.1 hypothetical protein [Rhizobium paknamense]